MGVQGKLGSKSLEMEAPRADGRDRGEAGSRAGEDLNRGTHISIVRFQAVMIGSTRGAARAVAWTMS